MIQLTLFKPGGLREVAGYWVAAQYRLIDSVLERSYAWMNGAKWTTALMWRDALYCSLLCEDDNERTFVY
jgi:hypothetical protein